MARKPIVSQVERRVLEDRPLIIIGPEHPVWTDRLLPFEPLYGGIAWVKPPPDVDASWLVSLLREKNVSVKLVPPDRVDTVVVEAQPDTAPELGLQDARATIYELCRELAPRVGVDPEDAIREAENYLSAAAL